MQAVFYPYKSSYRMTVRGPGGSATCETGHAYNSAYFDDAYYRNDHYLTRSAIHPVTVAIPPQPYVVQYAQPSYPPYVQNYVPLSQIPYTGFDFGLVGNAIYWLTIILAAMGGAYLIVYSHSGHYPREFAREVAIAARNQAKVVRSLIQ